MNKKRLIIIGVCILAVIIVGVIIFISQNKGAQKGINEISKIQELVSNKTKENQNNIVFEDVNIEAKGSKIKGTAKIINKGESVSNKKISLVVYDEKGVMRGNNSISIDILAKEEKKEIEIEIIGSYFDLKTYEFKIVE